VRPGYNPFTVFIVIAWEKSESLITKVVNSGADDLLLRPSSISFLGARIETHIVRSPQLAENEGQGQDGH